MSDFRKCLRSPLHLARDNRAVSENVTRKKETYTMLGQLLPCLPACPSTRPNPTYLIAAGYPKEVN